MECIADQYGSDGNISEDPLLCDPVMADFHLQEGSPCGPFSPPNPECDLIGAWTVGCLVECTKDQDCLGQSCWDWCDPQDPAAHPLTGCVHEYRVKPYADVYPLPDGDGAVEGFDILCVLDAANDLNTYGCLTVLPSGYKAGDIWPCDSPDNAIEGFDILAVLDAANDIKWCPDPCP